MSLQGSLPDFNVVDVLQLLGAAGKTGVVRFASGPGAITRGGALYFRDGKPVAAETNGLVGVDALEVLSSWDSGSFTYHEGATSSFENLDLPATRLVEQIAAATEEWRRIRELLPAPSATVRVTVDLPSDVEEVRLSREEWSLIARIACPQTVAALAEQAGGGLPAYRMLKKLVSDGLLSVESQGG